MKNKYEIKVMTATKTQGSLVDFVLVCELDNIGCLTQHDIAARLFAMEFAINNHSELPMRVHINELA